MLTQFHLFPEMIDDLRLQVLEQHVYNTDFPRSLLSFGETARHNNELAKDWTLWRQAIAFYFPVTVNYKRTAYLREPLVLFQSLYRSLQPLLSKHHLTFSQFVKAVIEQNADLAAEQMDVLQGLLLAAGHPMFKGTTLNANIYEHALLFAALLGNSGLVDTLLTERKFPFSKAAVCQALQDAARLNHPFIMGSLLTNMHQFLDSATLRNALITAAEQGNTRIVAQFLQQPFLRIISFSLKRVVHIAIAQNYTDMLSIILRGNDLHRYSCEIRTGALAAVEKNNTHTIEQAFRLAPAQFDDMTIRKLLRTAAKLGNNSLINLFCAHSAITHHPSVLLESLHLAMEHEHESTALLLLQAGRVQLKPFVKRELFLEAAKHGFNSIIDDLNKQDHLKVEVPMLQSAVNLARLYDHEDTVEQLTTALSQMNLNSAAKPITPSFIRHTSPFRSQPLEGHLQDKGRRHFIL